MMNGIHCMKQDPLNQKENCIQFFVGSIQNLNYMNKELANQIKILQDRKIYYMKMKVIFRIYKSLFIILVKKCQRIHSNNNISKQSKNIEIWRQYKKTMRSKVRVCKMKRKIIRKVLINKLIHFHCKFQNSKIKSQMQMQSSQHQTNINKKILSQKMKLISSKQKCNSQAKKTARSVLSPKFKRNSKSLQILVRMNDCTPLIVIFLSIELIFFLMKIIFQEKEVLGLFMKDFIKINMLLLRQQIQNKLKQKVFFEEVVAMLMCESSNLVKIYGVTVGEELIGSMLRIFIVMELLKWDLKQVLFDKQRMELSDLQRWKIIVDILKGLKVLEQRGYVHCDLKLQNVMLDNALNAKLVDFGLAKFNQQGTRKATISGFSERYSPKEYLEDNIVSHKVDIWSFGLLVYEVFKRKQVWSGLTGPQVMSKVISKVPFYDSNEKVGDDFVDQLITECLNYNYQERPTATELLAQMKEYLQKLNQQQAQESK
eukprot:TRINITY_DN47589_c0_g1_i1.p1 TRINITY_DN47589_c0_g1~~TRINITY_DN47589_c0_g1_i1.p1  ORF type:complete len:484 (-),score=43.05 TRINITY_DN47589_c0_g1_i1:64-1515(-)